MSKCVEHIQTLYSNPFLFAPVFCNFYKSLNEKQNNILLGYLLLPLVLYPPSQKFLGRARKTSSIRTMLSEKSRIYGLAERVTEFKTITNESIQFALDSGTLSFRDELSLETGTTNPTHTLHNLSKPATNLGILFGPYDVPTIYRTLGVKEI